MKLTSEDQTKLEEGYMLNRLIGDYGAALVKGGLRGDNIMDTMSRDKFIMNFVNRASSALKTAISGGIVDPTLSDKAPTEPTGVEVETPPKPSAPSAIDKYRDEQRKARVQARRAKNARTPVPNTRTQPHVRTVADPAATKAALKAKTGPGATTGSGFKNYVNAGPPKFRESKYDKLNSIFESLLEADMDTGAESIPSFLKRWLYQYIPGVDLTYGPSAKVINNLIDRIQLEYSKDKGKAALSQLAQAMYSIQLTNRGAQGSIAARQKAAEPKQAPASNIPPSAQVGQAINTMTGKDLVNTIAAALAKLKKDDLPAYTEFVKGLTASPAVAESRMNPRARMQK